MAAEMRCGNRPEVQGDAVFTAAATQRVTAKVFGIIGP
jgi:hypothetical protein